MPSRLVGLSRTLSWSDYPTVPRTEPGAGQTAVGAYTDASYELGTVSMVRATGGGVTLPDSLVVTINFNTETSWVADWVTRRSADYQTALLNHEQGHYNLVALLGRDMWVELVQLVGRSFPNQHALSADIDAITTRFNTAVAAIGGIYDRPGEANAGANATGQARWDGHIRSAFTGVRTPPLRLPDGTQAKVQLLSVLSGAGITVPTAP
jgi:hypothetical protein